MKATSNHASFPTLGELLFASRVTVLALLAGLALSACSSESDDSPPASGDTDTAQESFDLLGSLEVTGGPTLLDGTIGECFGIGDYDDLALGTTVTVEDAEGNTVGLGSLISSDGRAFVNDGNKLDRCTFAIRVPDVPIGSRFFSVEVANRGAVTLSAEDARAGELEVTLGGF